jgi:hypothetical protein
MSPELSPRILQRAETANTDPSPGNLQTLYESNEALMAYSYHTVINGDSVTITSLCARIDNDDSRLEARIAKSQTNDDFIYLIYPVGQRAEDAPNTHLLRLSRSAGRGSAPVLMFDGSDLSDSVNNAQDFSMARAITADLMQQKIRKDDTEVKAKQAAREAARLKHVRLGKRLGTIVSSISLAVPALFYPALTGNPDAKAGVVPMPSPVEWFVDWNNWHDHVAQGYEPPKGVEPLKPGTRNEIPIVSSTYDVAGAPVLKTETDHYGTHSTNTAEPGLYSFDLDDDESSIDVLDDVYLDGYSAELKSIASECGDNAQACLESIDTRIEAVKAKATIHCKPVSVDVTAGKFRVFAKDRSATSSVTVIASPKEVRFCMAPGVELPEATVYLHQDAERKKT